MIKIIRVICEICGLKKIFSLTYSLFSTILLTISTRMQNF